MSEAVPGMPPVPNVVARARDSAVAIMFRRVPGGASDAGSSGAPGVEVFWIRREASLAFAGGFYAFPGGSVDRSDASCPVEGAKEQDAVLRGCAARELLEEAGVLVAHGPKLDPDTVRAMRRALVDEKRTFPELLAAHGQTLHAADFHDAGRWITPPFMPRRFDTRFFLVEVPADTTHELWPGELAHGEWVKPKDALAQWEKGTALLHPPNLHALQVMAEFTTVEDALHKLRNPLYVPAHIAQRIEFQKGIRLFPMETATLPPATHTNAYVLGNGELVIVDPGSPEVRQYAKLLALIAGLKAEGKRPRAVLLTHHHQDHIGGAKAVMERLGIGLWCHERTADRVGLPVERLLKDGEELVIAGTPPMKLTVLHTPGHARGHVCLVDNASKAAIVGDMVAGVGTIVIDPPEGDMTDYLAQLQRLRDLPVGTLYPSHGTAIIDGPAKLNAYLRHREMREKKVLAAIPKEGITIQELVPRAYDDTPAAVHPIAERSTQAILIKLVRDGRVERREDRYFLAPPSAA